MRRLSSYWLGKIGFRPHVKPMRILQARCLNHFLPHSQHSSTMAARGPTALSSTSCWSPVRGSRWWAGGGSSTEIFSQELASTSGNLFLFQRWDAESDWSAGLSLKPFAQIGTKNRELAMFNFWQNHQQLWTCILTSISRPKFVNHNDHDLKMNLFSIKFKFKSNLANNS